MGSHGDTNVIFLKFLSIIDSVSLGTGLSTPDDITPQFRFHSELGVRLRILTLTLTLHEN